jgi:hypothetical protein
MSVGRALVVGVPQPHPSSGWSADFLAGVEPDAREMSDLLRQLRLNTTVLFAQQATARAVLNGIQQAADDLNAGDMFVLQYSGHGAQQRSQDQDEAEDQLLLTYDVPIVDDTLGALWPKFRPDVRIVVITDSCNSGSVVREIQTERGIVRETKNVNDAVPRFLSIGMKNSRTRSRDGNIEGLRGTLLHMAACLDAQQSMDIGNNGAFTHAFLSAYQAGYNGSYYQLFDRIRKTITSKQTPRMTLYGVDQQLLAEQKPFDYSATWPI